MTRGDKAMIALLAGTMTIGAGVAIAQGTGGEREGEARVGAGGGTPSAPPKLTDAVALALTQADDALTKTQLEEARAILAYRQLTDREAEQKAARDKLLASAVADSGMDAGKYAVDPATLRVVELPGRAAAAGPAAGAGQRQAQEPSQGKGKGKGKP